MENDTNSVFEEKLKQLKASRSLRLGALTRKKNEIRQLMENVCNVVLVKWKLESEFVPHCKEVDDWNDTVQAFLSTKDKEEMEKDKAEWYVPKAAALQEFIEEVKSWVDEAPASIPKNSKGSQRSSQVSRSSIASVKLQLESKRAELLGRASRLTQKQTLEQEEAILTAKKEWLEMETEMAANAAKLLVVEGYEDPHVVLPPSGDGMNEYLESGFNGTYNEMRDVFPQGKVLLASTTMAPGHSHSNLDVDKHRVSRHGKPDAKKAASKGCSWSLAANRSADGMTNTATEENQFTPQGTGPQRHHSPSGSLSFSPGEDNISNLINITEKQNVITDKLVKQQKLSALPP